MRIMGVAVRTSCDMEQRLEQRILHMCLIRTVSFVSCLRVLDMFVHALIYDAPRAVHSSVYIIQYSQASPSLMGLPRLAFSIFQSECLYNHKS